MGGNLISKLIGSLKKLQQTLYQLKHDSKVHKKLWNKISTIERFNLNEKINYEYDKKKHSKLPGDFNDSLFFGSWFSNKNTCCFFLEMSL